MIWSKIHSFFVSKIDETFDQNHVFFSKQRFSLRLRFRTKIFVRRNFELSIKILMKPKKGLMIRFIQRVERNQRFLIFLQLLQGFFSLILLALLLLTTSRKVFGCIWSKKFQRNQLEISDFQSLKTPIFHETFASNASKNFSRGRKKASKVSRRPAYIRALQRTNSHGHTTYQTFFIETNVSFKVFLKKSARNFWLSELENTNFSWNFCFKCIQKLF